MGDQIRVAIVDDDEVYRRTTGELLESAAGITLVGEARDGHEAISMVREVNPDVILLDIGILHASSMEPIPQIRELSPRTQILILHDEGQEPLVLKVFRKGALGHLVRETTLPDEIVAAIRAVSRGEAVVSSAVAGRILDHVIQERQAFERR